MMLSSSAIFSVTVTAEPVMGVAVHEDAELEFPSFFPSYACDKLVDVIVYPERIIVRYPVVDEPHRVLYYTGVHLRTYLSGLIHLAGSSLSLRTAMWRV